ncbi:MAG: hypothetical protein RL263_619 [Bacteroidota bacterium]|jgi:membrane associated rhomboid family serine protease
MRIYNKPFSPLNTAVINLVWVNVLAFLFVTILKLFPFGNFVFNFLSFWPSKPLWASFYSILTSIFIHDGFFHLLGNMLWLFFIGTILEDLIGKKHIYYLYFGGGIAGVFLFYLISKLTGNLVPIVGASAGISAIILATAVFTPHYRIFLFGIVEIELRWIVIIKVFLDFLGMFGGANAGGNQAHIGGYLFGLAYILELKGHWNFPKNWIPKKSSKPKRTATVSINQNSPSQAEIDRILDKISESGYDNLTAKEKETLFKASKK